LTCELFEIIMAIIISKSSHVKIHFRVSSLALNSGRARVEGGEKLEA
jgi:hypothetical protein